MKVNDYDVAEWEEDGREFLLLVCSECGKISNETCKEHLSDNWHLHVKAFKNPKEK